LIALVDVEALSCTQSGVARDGTGEQGAASHRFEFACENGADRPSEIAGLSGAPDKVRTYSWFLKARRSASRWPKRPLAMALAPQHASPALGRPKKKRKQSLQCSSHRLPGCELGQTLPRFKRDGLAWHDSQSHDVETYVQPAGNGLAAPFGHPARTTPVTAVFRARQATVSESFNLR